MRLASLFSGGKDSVFAAYIAEQMGHEISFLVSIFPSDDGSWVFHTPNLGVVPVMAESMNIPLIRADSDGTEQGDLDALRTVLSDLDIDGVVVGALWSDYQWDRIGSVLEGLGLVMIAPLWRKSQDMIFDEMLSAGIDAIVVGVFAEGLGDEWLGRRLDAEAKTDLVALRERYGINIMGEGGEYESMVIDSPMFERRLSVTEHAIDGGRSSGTYEVVSVELSEKV